MSRRTNHVTYNYHYHYMLPDEMAPMGMMYGMNPMSELPAMYDHGCPMPDNMHGSHLGGNPHSDGVFTGAFAGDPFISPFFFPFFFTRRRFPFFFPIFFPFF